MNAKGRIGLIVPEINSSLDYDLNPQDSFS